jgi:hypothetical protein
MRIHVSVYRAATFSVELSYFVYTIAAGLYLKQSIAILLCVTFKTIIKRFCSFKRYIYSSYRDRDVNKLFIAIFLLTKLIRFVLNQVANCEECKCGFISVDNEFDREYY